MRIKHFSLSNERISVSFGSCNFRCLHCYQENKYSTELAPEETITLLKKVCQRVYTNGEYRDTITRESIPKIFIFMGQEPTLDRRGLVEMVQRLKEMEFDQIILYSNGYLLGEEDSYVEELLDAGITLINIGLYAVTDATYKAYTGHSNKNALKAIKRISEVEKLRISCMYAPNFIEVEEIEKIAWFVKGLNNTKLVINPLYLSPKHSKDVNARVPTSDEIELLRERIKEIYPNIICRSQKIVTHRIVATPGMALTPGTINYGIPRDFI